MRSVQRLSFISPVFLYLLLSTPAILASHDSRSAPAFVASQPRPSSFVSSPRTNLGMPLGTRQGSTTRLYVESPSNRTAMDHQHKKSSTELSASLSSYVTADFGCNKYDVYCDLDGVLVDFEIGVRKLLNRPPHKIVKGTMWKHIARANAFYEGLPWTKDGKRLWSAIRHLEPDILTGVPYPKSSRIEKYNWCKRELGLDELHHVDMAFGCKEHETVNGNLPKKGVTNVITCWSNNKHMECDDHRA
jgi:hypothetical protein